MTEDSPGAAKDTEGDEACGGGGDAGSDLPQYTSVKDGLSSFSFASSFPNLKNCFDSNSFCIIDSMDDEHEFRFRTEQRPQLVNRVCPDIFGTHSLREGFKNPSHEICPLRGYAHPPPA